jgi:hypothetical protein
MGVGAVVALWLTSAYGRERPRRRNRSSPTVQGLAGVAGYEVETPLRSVRERSRSTFGGNQP